MKILDTLLALCAVLLALWLVTSFVRPEVAGMFAGAFSGMAVLTVSLCVARGWHA